MRQDVPDQVYLNEHLKPQKVGTLISGVCKPGGLGVRRCAGERSCLASCELAANQVRDVVASTFTDELFPNTRQYSRSPKMVMVLLNERLGLISQIKESAPVRDGRFTAT